MKSYPSILGLFLLAGCTTTVKEIPVTEDSFPKAQNETRPKVAKEGRLTLIRIEPEPAPPEVLIHIDGELAAVLGNESYVTMTLPAGTNLLVLDWEDSPLKFEEMIVLEPDIQPWKYLSLIRKFEIQEIVKTTNATDVTMVETIGLFEISPAIGKGVIENLEPDYSFTAEEYVSE